jgi:hypothetical protein
LCTRRIFFWKISFFGLIFGLIFFHVGIKLVKISQGI